MPGGVFFTRLESKFGVFLGTIALLCILAIGNCEIGGQIGECLMGENGNMKTAKHLRMGESSKEDTVKSGDMYEYVCPLSRAVFATLPEGVGKGPAGEIPAFVVAGMCSTIIRRMVEEVDRTGTSNLLASLIMGDTVRPFYKEKLRYLNKEELVERAVCDLKERKETELLMCVLREIMLDFTADVTSDVCAMEPYLLKKE